MANRPFSIMVFAREGFKLNTEQIEHNKEVKFPFVPDEIWNGKYSFHLFNVGGGTTNRLDISHEDLASHSGVSNVVASILNSEGMRDRYIFTVHPNNLLLPLYRWYLLKNKTPIQLIDQEMQMLSRRTIDICEAFHKPTILTLDRRENFNYRTIARWLDIPVAGEQSVDECLNVLSELCQRL